MSILKPIRQNPPVVRQVNLDADPEMAARSEVFALGRVKGWTKR